MKTSLFILILSLFSAGQVCAQMKKEGEVLTSIAEIRALGTKVEEHVYEVDIVAQLMMRGPYSRGAFLFDGENGIYAALPRRIGLGRKDHLGCALRIRGVTRAGYFLPHILVTDMENVGRPKMPAPIEIDESALDDPDLECQWVTFTGTVIAVGEQETPDTEQVGVTILFERRQAVAYVRLDRTTVDDMRALLHRKVRVRGITASRVNAQRQLAKRYFKVASGSFIKPIRSSKKDDGVQEISKLLGASESSQQPVKIRGIVTHSDQNKFYLRDETGSLLVFGLNDKSFKRGDLVDAMGQIHPQSSSPTLFATEMSKLLRGKEPEAVEIEMNQSSFSSSYHHELVTCSAYLVGIQKRGKKTLLRCESEGRHFEALLDQSYNLPDTVEPGCEVSLTGIVELFDRDVLISPQAKLGRIRLILRDSSDITVTKRPPIWSIEKILLGLTVVFLLALLILIWGISLRARVRKQTDLIAEQIERQAILDERQRLARELHDTLQQNMSGIALLLSAVDKKIETDESARTRLHLAQEMLDQCRQEGRAAITELRSTHATGRSLEALLDKSLEKEASMNEIHFETQTSGEVFSLSDLVSQHSLGIVEEAVRNALRHSRAQNICVSFQYSSNELTVTVTDDGIGLDPELLVPEGHYGIIGMKERAAEIQAFLTFSRLEKGTAIKLTIKK